MSASNQQVIECYIAIDAHKHYIVVGGLDAQMEIVLPLHRIDISRFSEWAQKHLELTHAVIIEATALCLEVKLHAARLPVAVDNPQE